MRNKRAAEIVGAFFLIAILVFAEDKKETFKPKEGYVPNAETAIKIAIAVWTPIYGAEEIEKEKPYKATLSNGIWTVKGSLPEGMKGGVAEADIAKDDARILRVIHGK
jgi:hypothetical protein